MNSNNNNKLVLFNPFGKLHSFLAECILYEWIERKNHKIGIHIDDTWTENNINQFIENEIHINDILLFIIHPIYFLQNEFMKSIMMKILELKVKVKRILYITEPLTLMMERHNYKYIIQKYKIEEIWTYTQNNIHLLQIPFRKFILVPPQFNQIYHFLDIKSENENYDLSKIVFIGNKTNKRNEIFQEFGNDFIHRENVWSKNEWTELLKEYKFYINIHRIPNCQTLETLRIIPILSNGGIVISEKCNQNEMIEYQNYNIYFCERNEMNEMWNKIKNEFHENFHEKETERIIKWKLFRENKQMNIITNTLFNSI